MRISLLKHLCCPICKGKLDVELFSAEQQKLSSEDCKRSKAWGIDISSVETIVKEGALLCRNCNIWYPIINYVPVMLDFSTPLHKTFHEENKKIFDSLGPFKSPDNIPRPGELSIQKSFTRQWDGLGFDDDKFGIPIEKLKVYHRVELDWPSWVLKTPGKKLLDVGCGYGQEALILQEITDDEIFAIDLNISLINSGQYMSTQPFIHTVVASLFNLPFPKSYFDIVFSNGVLIHTYSTRTAFESILSHMNDNGMIYVWICAWERKFGSLRKNKSLRGTSRDFLEIFARPIIAKLPLVLLDAVILLIAANTYSNNWFQNALSHFFGKIMGINIPLVRYRKFKNVIHETRDFWTPVYVQHESVIEVIQWFEQNELEYKFLDYSKFKQSVGFGSDNIQIRGIRNK